MRRELTFAERSGRIKYHVSEKDRRSWNFASPGLLRRASSRDIGPGRFICPPESPGWESLQKVTDPRKDPSPLFRQIFFTNTKLDFSFPDFKILYSNWVDLCLDKRYDRIMLQLCFTGLMALYGGVHLAVSSSHSPSKAETLLWQVSCYFFLGVSPMLLMFWLSLKLYEKHTKRNFVNDAKARWQDFQSRQDSRFDVSAQEAIEEEDMRASRILQEPNGLVSLTVRSVLDRIERARKWNSYRKHRPLKVVPELFNIVHSTFATCIAIGYVAARVYIVVEAFISLRSVPLGVYADVPWTNYFPHL